MDIGFLIRGMIIGFSIAAPVGPMGVLVIRRTLAQGRQAGLVSGLGIASGDTIYGFVAGFGLTLISGFLVDQQFWLKLIGGIFLCYLGITTFISKPAERAASAEGRGMLGLYTSTLFLTLTNPPTILSFAAIMAGLGVGSSTGDYLSATWLVVGVFIGSATWWLFLSSATNLLRTKLASKGLAWINRLSGVVLFTFGLLALLSLWR